MSDNARESCLAKSGRTKDQGVIKRLATLFSRSQKDFHLFTDNMLSPVIRQRLRPNSAIQLVILGRGGFGGHQSVCFYRHRVLFGAAAFKASRISSSLESISSACTDDTNLAASGSL